MMSKWETIISVTVALLCLALVVYITVVYYH